MNWWIVSFFDDEKTTLRNKNYVKKIGFMGCEKDVGSTQNGHF